MLMKHRRPRLWNWLNPQIVLWLCMALYTTPRSIAMNKQSKVRQPAVAGTFYPASATELQAEVQRFLKGAALPELPAPVVAVMAPHAGYVFSAQVAAPAYLAMAKADFETIVIIGHDFGRQARGITAILADHDAYQTPLGPVAVDTELGQRLQAALPTVIVHNGVHAREHTIEVHLPFVKTLKPDAKILPVLFGEATPDNCRAFARALQKAAGNKKIMIMASTDLCHILRKRRRNSTRKRRPLSLISTWKDSANARPAKALISPIPTPQSARRRRRRCYRLDGNHTGRPSNSWLKPTPATCATATARVWSAMLPRPSRPAKAASPQQSESTAQPEPAGADFTSPTACKELLAGAATPECRPEQRAGEIQTTGRASRTGRAGCGLCHPDQARTAARLHWLRRGARSVVAVCAGHGLRCGF